MRRPSSYIYRGPPGSYQWAYVQGFMPNSPVKGETFCTGGHRTGELCGWVVDQVGINFTNVRGEIVKHVTRAVKYFDFCINVGDSGGPAYINLSNGNVQAKGLQSQGANI